MVGPSKILTVSYGTFSCTLEGFDEPFNTMKAIAEYFRDLAADDRYFGAEPPTPDAEMLHRIAEREIQRRVEAKINEHGVVLRQTEEAAAPTPAIVAPVAAPVVAPAAIVAEPAVMDAAPVAEPVVPVAASTVVVAAEEETVEAVAEMPAPDEAEDMAEDMAEADVPELAADSTDDAAEAEAPATIDLSQLEDEGDAAEELAEEAEELSLDAIMAAAQVDLPATVDTAPAEAEPAADSLAAKLQRIRAVVETVRAGQPAAFDEDEPTDLQPAVGEGFDSDFGFELDMSDDTPDLVAAEAARAEAREEALTEAQADEQTGEEDEQDDAPITLDTAGEEDISFLDEEAEAPEAEADEPVAETVAEADAYEDEEYAVATAEEDSALLARLSDLAQSTAAEAGEAPAANQPARAVTPPPVPEHDASEDMAGEDMTGEEEIAAAGPHPDESHPSFYERARARVIRIGKAATRLGGKSDSHAESAAEDEHEDEPAALADAPQDEPAHVEHAAFVEQSDEEGGDVERLMEEARVKLEGAENRRRFSAIAHLKAAVAATLADRKMQPEPAPEHPEGEAATGTSLYRDDLSKAVRPRRPAAEAGSATRRPSLDVRPAPLVLVSEQRVDRDADSSRDASAIRPRRVSASRPVLDEEDRIEDADADGITPETASNFAEFADSLGAHNLTDLLEAAAVYTSSVEGQEHFTRPQLLRKVEFVSSRGDYNREDGLRSFGMLLRQGKIQKVAPGQFAIADASKYANEARRAAH